MNPLKIGFGFAGATVEVVVEVVDRAEEDAGGIAATFVAAIFAEGATMRRLIVVHVVVGAVPVLTVGV